MQLQPQLFPTVCTSLCALTLQLFPPKSEGEHPPAGLADCCDWCKKDNDMIGVKTSIHLHEGFPATGASIPSLALQTGCSHHEVAGGETPSCAGGETPWCFNIRTNTKDSLQWPLILTKQLSRAEQQPAIESWTRQSWGQCWCSQEWVRGPASSFDGRQTRSYGNPAALTVVRGGTALTNCGDSRGNEDSGREDLKGWYLNLYH